MYTSSVYRRKQVYLVAAPVIQSHGTFPFFVCHSQMEIAILMSSCHVLLV